MLNFAGGFFFSVFVCSLLLLIVNILMCPSWDDWMMFKSTTQCIFVILVVQTGGAPWYIKICFVPHPVICFATSNIFSPQGLSCSSWSPIMMLLCNFPSCCSHRNVAPSWRKVMGWKAKAVLKAQGGTHVIPIPALLLFTNSGCSVAPFPTYFPFWEGKCRNGSGCAGVWGTWESPSHRSVLAWAPSSLSGQQLRGGSCRNYLLKENN